MSLLSIIATRTPRVLVGAGLAVALASALNAQAQNKGAISGTVRDPVGGFAAKVVVQAQGTEGQVHRATTDAAGKYTITGLPFGTYELSVTIPGLKGFVQRDVRVSSPGPIVVDIKLEEGTQLSTLGEDPAGIAAD